MKSYPKAIVPPNLVTAVEKDAWWRDYYEKEKGLLHRIKFYRIVLDEAQVGIHADGWNDGLINELTFLLFLLGNQKSQRPHEYGLPCCRGEVPLGNHRHPNPQQYQGILPIFQISTRAKHWILQDF